jgi:hypothetical protein
MKDHAFIYYRYNLGEERRVWMDQSNPIIASIATFRAFNRDAKIYILDPEPVIENYGPYIRLLDFHVIKVNPEINFPGINPRHERLVSRPFDLWKFSHQIKEKIIVSVDSDIFWIRDPMPLAKDPSNFCGDPRGAGFFYFDKESPQVEVFFNLWRSLLLGAIHSEDIRVRMRLNAFYRPSVEDELAYLYMIKNGLCPGYTPTHPLEHYWMTDPFAETVDLDARNYHVHSGHFDPTKRLEIARRVIEFNRAIKVSLGDKHANTLFGDKLPDVPFTEMRRLMS